MFSNSAFSRIVPVATATWLSVTVSSPVASFAPSEFSTGHGHWAFRQLLVDPVYMFLSVKMTAIGCNWAMDTIPVCCPALTRLPSSISRKPARPEIGPVGLHHHPRAAAGHPECPGSAATLAASIVAASAAIVAVPRKIPFFPIASEKALTRRTRPGAEVPSLKPQWRTSGQLSCTGRSAKRGPVRRPASRHGACGGTRPTSKSVCPRLTASQFGKPKVLRKLRLDLE